MKELYKIAIPANSVARAIAYAIEQPSNVEIDEIVGRPTVQELKNWVNPSLNGKPEVRVDELRSPVHPCMMLSVTCHGSALICSSCS